MLRRFHTLYFTLGSVHALARQHSLQCLVCARHAIPTAAQSRGFRSSFAVTDAVNTGFFTQYAI